MNIKRIRFHILCRMFVRYKISSYFPRLVRQLQQMIPIFPRSSWLNQPQYRRYSNEKNTVVYYPKHIKLKYLTNYNPIQQNSFWQTYMRLVKRFQNYRIQKTYHLSLSGTRWHHYTTPSCLSKVQFILISYLNLILKDLQLPIEEARRNEMKCQNI
jgi:hypothetical protein